MHSIIYETTHVKIVTRYTIREEKRYAIVNITTRHILSIYLFILSILMHKEME